MTPSRFFANFDFHCHSVVSDGLLPPSDLARRAAANGVDAWALTDHDTLDGLAEAAEATRAAGGHFVPGVEISVDWRTVPVHVVGLGFDPGGADLAGGLAALRLGRRERASRMAAALERIGIGGALEGALRHAKGPDLVSRAHFARYLVESGVSKDVPSVFDAYLTPGKPGYVDHRWATLEAAVGWIHAAGGVAVVAHPARYRQLSNKDLHALFNDFKALGGEAIEVVCASHSPNHVLHFARLARRFGFHASRGSDFHGPSESYIDLGALPPLPEDLKPVWRLLS